jgi:hypothetical protein
MLLEQSALQHAEDGECRSVARTMLSRARHPNTDCCALTDCRLLARYATSSPPDDQ